MRPLVFVAAGVILAYLVGCSAAAPRSPRPVASGRSTDSSAGASSPSTTHVRRALFTRPAAFRLPVPVSGEAVAARDGELIVLGGLDANGVSTSSVTALDTVRGRVRAAGSLAEPLHDEGAASVGATTLVFGGGSSAGTDAIESLSPGAAAARFAGKLPTPRSDAVALSLGGRAYVVGGYDGATLSSGVLATADGRQVRSVAALPVPVRYPAVAALGDSIYVAGGLTAAGSATDVIQVVHPRSGTARRIGHLPYPVDHAAAVALGRNVYVLGGDVAGVPSRRIVTVTPGGTAEVAKATLPMPVADAATGVLDDRGYLVGGLGRGSAPLASIVAVGLRAVR